jgi:C-terminal peptidase prc
LKKKSFFVSLLIGSIVLLSSTITCEPKTKKKNTKFAADDFLEVIKSVERHYIDKNYDVDRAYIDAASFALMSLPHSLYLFPENYYTERDKYEEKDDIMPGKTFKILPSDSYLIFEPDYKKVDEIRKARAKSDVIKPKMSNDEVKKLIEREQTRKNILSSRWEQANFSKKDFDKIMNFIQENLAKYKTPPIKETLEDIEEDTEKEEYSIKDAWLAAANGYLNSLDPHSNVFLKDQWEESMAKISDGSFEGIGAILSGGGNREVIVENPLEDRPAVKAGIRSGDVIVAVDGKSTKGTSLDKVVKRIKGKKGTSVALKIKRKGMSKPIEIKVVRDKIEIKNVQSRLLKEDEQIGYIKLSGFVRSQTESSEKEVEEAYHKLEDEAKKKGIKLKALILDLRNNAGGYLDLAVDISDMFISNGVIVSTRSPGKGGLEESLASSSVLTKLPLAVLINAKSASASEIVASAIKDHNRGILLGERTFGKATVQKLMELTNNKDYVIKLTQSRYYSPSGKTIQVVGVEPDFEISSEEDGSFPFQYREENMWNHLPKIPSEEKSMQKFPKDAYENWIKKNGVSEKLLSEVKDGPIKPDYQLIRSLDYINAMLSLK